MFGFRGSLLIGMGLAVLTMPFYAWWLHNLSICVAIPLGFVFACIIDRYAAINRRKPQKPQRRARRLKHTGRHGQIRVDKYGRIFDPDD
jgi:uncharacterized membrane protein